jgi:hypothetical protein
LLAGRKKEGHAKDTPPFRKDTDGFRARSAWDRRIAQHGCLGWKDEIEALTHDLLLKKNCFPPGRKKTGSVPVFRNASLGSHMMKQAAL